jgi:mannose-6-phosphate isomerase-like protein (cupin superfamily)
MNIKKFRRIVTGNVNNKAVVVSDNILESVKEFGAIRPGVAHTYVWPAGGSMKPNKGGTSFLIAQFDPEDPAVLKTLDGRRAFAAVGAEDNWVKTDRHPFMHKTHTVDYGVVLQGEVRLLLDEDEIVTLHQGDLLVQQGTVHAWSNRGTEPCVIAFILVDQGEQ